MGKETGIEPSEEKQFQYTVTVRDTDSCPRDREYPYKQYRWASESEIKRAQSTIESNANSKKYPKVLFGHSASISFRKDSEGNGLLGSLEIIAEYKEKANECAKYLKLPLPFQTN